MHEHNTKRKERYMDNLQQVREELKGRTNFDKEHEGELFENISAIEVDGTGIEPLGKSDWILAALFAICMGLAPVAYYAIKYF